MMPEISLSWVIGYGDSSKGGHQLWPNWVAIEYALDQIRAHSGSVTLSTNHQSGQEMRTLQVISEHSLSVLTLGGDNDGDYEVRSYTNADARGKDIAILGDRWSDKLVCADFDIVRKAFKEFYDLGDVSMNVLR